MQSLESLVRSQTAFDHGSASTSTSFLAGNEDMAGTSTADPLSVGLRGLLQNQDVSFRGDDIFSQSMNLDASITDYQSSGQRLGHDFHPYGRTEVAAHPRNDIVSRTHSAADDAAGRLLAQSLRQTVTESKNLIQEIREKGAVLNDVLRLGLQSLEQSSLNTGEAETLNESLVQQQGQLQLPDLRANTIRITQMSFISARINNAALLGLTAAEISADDTDSPFYTAGLAQDATADLAQGVFVNIKQDLRPTQNQLTYRHHPYIDALPFPTFRERVIALLQVDPPILDEEELCHDLQNDGITCWGSSLGAGVGNSGAPWDIRSWEARPWFMRKWWMLTGGTGAEMYQQTRWWCEMRGDRSESPW